MANQYYNEYSNGYSNPYRTEKPLPSAPRDSEYTLDRSTTNRSISPIHDSDPYASHSQLSTAQQAYSVPSYYRTDSDPLQSRDNIPLQHQEPKMYDDQFQKPQRPRVERQESESFLIQQEARGAPPAKKKGRFDWSQIPWVVYTVTLIQICVFIAELVKSANLTGSPVTKPSQNPMLGPNNNLLINMGARYVGCMRNEVGIQDVPATAFFCPNSTDSTNVNQQTCTLRELCGFTSTYGVPIGNPDPNQKGPSALTSQPPPNQWFRFIIPIFLHGGFIHIASNLLLQLMIARDMEKVIGSIRFALVYFSAGIFGFVFGGNYAASGIASTGCSGSLFGVIGLVFLDLFYTWSDRDSPWFDLMVLLFTVVIEIVIGLLPTGLDNFSHIGGLIVGLVLGLCLLHSPNALRKQLGTSPILRDRNGQRKVKQQRRKSQPVGSTMVVYGTTGTDATGFLKDPKNFFKDRKPLWWVWWIFRVAALLAVIIGFILLLDNFYATHESNCSWCKYVSCIDHDNWCQKYDLTHTSTAPPTATSGGARMML